MGKIFEIEARNLLASKSVWIPFVNQVVGTFDVICPTQVTRR